MTPPCPYCVEPRRIRSQGRLSKTCGAPACVAALRGRAKPTLRTPEPSYSAMHVRLRRDLSSKSCEHCGATEYLQAALRHDAPPKFLRGDPHNRVMFSIRAEDYMKLCRRCHMDYDRWVPGGLGGRRNQANRTKTHCPHGHSYDEVNTRLERRSWGWARICRKCVSGKSSRRRAREETNA